MRNESFRVHLLSPISGATHRARRSVHPANLIPQRISLRAVEIRIDAVQSAHEARNRVA
jgi:hypothetical protein